MKLKYLMIPLIATVTVLTGCQETADNIPVVYMTDAQHATAKSVTIDTPPNGTAISVSSSVVVDKDTPISLELCPQLLEAYNAQHGKNYLVPPEGSYEFNANEVIIPSGYNLSSAVNFTITSLEQFKEGATYCMPIGIKSVTGGALSILEPSRTLFVVLKTPVISKAIYIGSGNKYKVPGFKTDPNLAALPQLTLETRVYVTNFNNGADNSSVIGIEGSCSVRFGDVKITNNTLQICHESYQPAAVGKPFDTNKWYHVAAVWTGTSWDIYINGQYATGVATQGETISLISGDSWGFGLGSFSDWQGSRPLNGYLAEARVWTRALTPAEIANNMNYVDPQSKDLLAYWRMNAWEASGNGNIVKDLTGHGYDAVGGSKNPQMMDTKWL